MVTWMLTGLWHGASVNFVLWGVYFGVLLIIEKLVLSKVLSKTPSAIKHIYALFFIVMGWVIFDFTDMAEMGAFISRMFGGTGALISREALYTIVSFIPTLIVAIFASLPLGKMLMGYLEGRRIKPVIETAGLSLALVLCIASLISSSYNPFLYFRF
jgi:alginate O-acetyltransferase complex protein AlgI